MNAYVVFKTKDAAVAALAANGSLLDGKHLTCDIAANKVSALAWFVYLSIWREQLPVVSIAKLAGEIT